MPHCDISTTARLSSRSNCAVQASIIVITVFIQIVNNMLDMYLTKFHRDISNTAFNQFISATEQY